MLLSLRKLKINKSYALIFLFILFFALIQFILFKYDDDLIRRYSFFYFSSIIQNKMDYINLNFNSISDFLIGGFIEGKANLGIFMASDKTLISFVYSYGFLYLIFFIFIGFRLSRNLWIYTLILVISSLHYGSLFFLTGQVLFSHIFVDSKYTKFLNNNFYR